MKETHAATTVSRMSWDETGRPKAHVWNPFPVPERPASLIEALESARAARDMYINFLDHRNEEHPVSFKEVWEGAYRYAVYLKNMGLKKGARVIILLPTGQDFICAFYGSQLAGGLPVPVAMPYMFATVQKYLENLRHILKNSEAEYFVTYQRVKDAIASLFLEESSLKHVIYHEQVTRERERYPGFPSLDGESIAFLQYTSGSTSQPKGVMVTHRNIVSNVYGIGSALGMSETDVGVSWLPLSHDMGLIGVLFSALYWHFPVHVLSPESFVIHPKLWLKTITKFGAHMSPAPNFGYHFCASRITDKEAEDLNLSSWRTALNGAEPVDVTTIQRFTERFSRFGFGSKVMLPVYGMAENCLAATFPTLDNPVETRTLDRDTLEQNGEVLPRPATDPSAYRAVSVGYPLAGQAVAISANGQGFAGERVVGEIMVSGRCVTPGYYNNERETENVLKHGWLHTGDLGYMDGQRLFVTGRKKEMIIKMGRNYYPYDIERVASEVRGVRKGCLAAFSTPNPDRGSEDLVLVVETRENGRGEREKIAKSIHSELLTTLGVKADRIVLVEPKTIPKTSSGKVQRVLCRRIYMSGTLLPDLAQRATDPTPTTHGSFIAAPELTPGGNEHRGGEHMGSSQRT